MNLMRTTKPGFDRRALATQAMQAAIACRAKAKLDQHGPICIYGLCETLGVTVRFNASTWRGCTSGARRRASTSRRTARCRGALPARHRWPEPRNFRCRQGIFWFDPQNGRGSPREIKCKQSVIRAIPANETGVGREWNPSVSGLAAEFGNPPTSSRIFVATEPLTFLQPKTIAAFSLSLLVH
jgi:hypothetical protein